MDNKTYTFDEAFKASKEYFAGDELAAKVWVNKYALKDAFGNIFEKTPTDMHHRLAGEIARIEKNTLTRFPNRNCSSFLIISATSYHREVR